MWRFALASQQTNTFRTKRPCFSVAVCVEINVDTLNEEARIHEISSMLGLGNGQDSKEMAKCLLEATHSDETK